MNFFLETLGCARNQVNSEELARHLTNNGWLKTFNPAKAKTIIINTCGFTKTAINESINSILKLTWFKKHGLCKNIIVIGCLPQRFKNKITKLLPEVDLFLGTKTAFDTITKNVKYNFKNKTFSFPSTSQNNTCINKFIKRKIKLKHSAYLKIAEGCNKNCAYCIIPKLKGKQKSRKTSEIIYEAKQLIKSGTKELILIAQDTTCYGIDISYKPKFNSLLTNLSKLSKNIWIRFLYSHPESITDSIIETVAKHENLCPYFDVPIQHIANNILKTMNRKSNKNDLLSLFQKIKTNIKNATLRTTIIVGFPGETYTNFSELIEFIKKVQFNHLGVFIYSDSNDLSSHKLPNHINKTIANLRYNYLMSIQAKISYNHLQRILGKKIKVIIESLSPFSQNGLFICRSINQAPKIDGVTYVRTKNIQKKINIGNIITVIIIGTFEYDLIGEICE